MRKIRNKKCIVTIGVIVPIMAALAFVLKMVRERKRKKYTSTSF